MIELLSDVWHERRQQSQTSINTCIHDLLTDADFRRALRLNDGFHVFLYSGHQTPISNVKTEFYSRLITKTDLKWVNVSSGTGSSGLSRTKCRELYGCVCVCVEPASLFRHFHDTLHVTAVLTNRLGSSLPLGSEYVSLETWDDGARCLLTLKISWRRLGGQPAVEPHRPLRTPRSSRCRLQVYRCVCMCVCDCAVKTAKIELA